MRSDVGLHRVVPPCIASKMTSLGIGEGTKNYGYEVDRARTRDTHIQTYAGAESYGERRNHPRTLTKWKMEALSVLQEEVERLQERRERLIKGITRIERRMENEKKWAEEVMSGSLEESAKRSSVVAEERGRITKIREKIRRVDWQMRMWEERIERVRDEGERGEEESKGVLDEFEGAIKRATRRIEMEQRMLEQMRAELSDMRGYI